MKIRLPSNVYLYTEGAKERFTEYPVCQEDVKVSFELENSVLSVYLEADETPVRYIRLRFNYTENEMRKDSVKVFGDNWERGYGELEWRNVYPDRSMPWVCAVSNRSDLEKDHKGRFTECFGVKTRPSSMCFWQYDGCGATLFIDVRCGGAGVILHKRKLKACEIVFNEYRDMSAFDSLDLFYKSLCDDPLYADHKVYGSNNWYYAYGNSSHDEILGDSDILARLTKGLKQRPYMVIDDGWQKNRCDAPWDITNERFPDMKKLAKEMAEKDVIPGIWVRYLVDKTYCLDFLPKEARSQRDDKYLDPSHPEVIEYVKKTTKMLCDWGYKLIKHDFSSYDIMGYWGFSRQNEFAKDGWTFYDRSRTSAEIIVDFYKAILEASEGRSLILGCNVIGHLAAGLVHANRTGDDTSGKSWERTRKYGVNTLAFRMLHSNFYAPDADCVGITESIDWSLNRKWLYALANSGTPLFVSCKPGVLSESENDELREAFRINSLQKDKLVPIDWMETTCPRVWELNGERIKFSWVSDEGAFSFNP